MNSELIKQVAKAKNITLQEVAEKLGISYLGLYKKIKTAKFETLQDIAGILQCDVHELIEPGSDFAHFYDQTNGQWLGIRKKS